MKYGNVWVSITTDCGENAGGYYCQVYKDEDMSYQIDDFCIHTYDCDCTNDNDVENFIMLYVNEMYN